MRLVYDNIVFSVQRVGGISVVWQELLDRIQKKAEVELKYIDVDCHQVDNYSRNQLDIATEDVVKTIHHPKWERYLPARYEADDPFLFHSSYYRHCPNPQAINITTVHDFTYELFVTL